MTVFNKNMYSIFKVNYLRSSGNRNKTVLSIANQELGRETKAKFAAGFITDGHFNTFLEQAIS